VRVGGLAKCALIRPFGPPSPAGGVNKSTFRMKPEN
jgi:hypothetical protein